MARVSKGPRLTTCRGALGHRSIHPTDEASRALTAGIDQEDAGQQAGPGQTVGGLGRLFLRLVGGRRLSRVVTAVLARTRHDVRPTGRIGRRTPW